MTTTAVDGLGLLVLVVAFGGGGALVLRTRAQAAGVLLLVTSALLLATAVALPGAAARPLLVAAAGLGALPALVAYPRLGWRHPLDFTAFVTAVALGGVATWQAQEAEVLDALGLTAAAVVLAHGLWRFERADETDRVAALWLLLALGTTVLVFGHSLFLLGETAAVVVGTVCFATVPLAMTLGVRRPEVVDVRGLITGAVVSAVAVVSFIAVFAGAAAALELAGSARPPIGLLAVLGAAAAAGFHPLRVALRGVVDELLFGDRPDPLRAATTVADRIGDDPALALRAVREAMVLPYAALRVDGAELAASGEPVAHTRRLPLVLGADAVGEIVVGLRPGDLGLSEGDADVLRIVAPLLAQTLRARALADDLERSRGQAIAAIEDERRRPRRDLHDGLGPTLSGIAFTADAARNSLGELGTADELLRGLRADATSAIGEIRRLVYDMRPPALDELGLVPALRQRAGLLRTADGHALAVDVEAPGDLPALPAAVEVAAYRIVLEALTNTARHSGSARAEVLIAVDGRALTVDVRDHGTTHRHGQRPWTGGVGMASMRERAAEVGGTLSAEPSADGGRVVAVLPLGLQRAPQEPAGQVGGEEDHQPGAEDVALVEPVVVAREHDQHRPDLGERGDQNDEHGRERPDHHQRADSSARAHRPIVADHGSGSGGDQGVARAAVPGRPAGAGAARPDPA